MIGVNYSDYSISISIYPSDETEKRVERNCQTDTVTILVKNMIMNTTLRILPKYVFEFQKRGHNSVSVPESSYVPPNITALGTDGCQIGLGVTPEQSTQRLQIVSPNRSQNPHR